MRAVAVVLGVVVAVVVVGIYNDVGGIPTASSVNTVRDEMRGGERREKKLER